MIRKNVHSYAEHGNKQNPPSLRANAKQSSPIVMAAFILLSVLLLSFSSNAQAAGLAACRAQCYQSYPCIKATTKNQSEYMACISGRNSCLAQCNLGAK